MTIRRALPLKPPRQRCGLIRAQRLAQQLLGVGSDHPEWPRLMRVMYRVARRHSLRFGDVFQCRIVCGDERPLHLRELVKPASG